MKNWLFSFSIYSIVLITLVSCDFLLPEVEYRVTGTALTVDLTIENSNGGTSQYSDEPLPWSYSYTGRSDDFVYVSAQNQGDTGTVTATIYIDGDVYKTSTSSGAYVIATASGSIP
jgi:hypothetical protein